MSDVDHGFKEIRENGADTAPANLHNLEEQFGADTTRELVRAYLEDTGGVLDKMQEAIINRDAMALKPLAHLLKSASRIVGATTLSSQSSEMEGHCGGGGDNWLMIETFFETYKQSFDSTTEYLRQYVQ